MAMSKPRASWSIVKNIGWPMRRGLGIVGVFLGVDIGVVSLGKKKPRHVGERVWLSTNDGVPAAAEVVRWAASNKLWQDYITVA